MWDDVGAERCAERSSSPKQARCPTRNDIGGRLHGERWRRCLGEPCPTFGQFNEAVRQMMADDPDVFVRRRGRRGVRRRVRHVRGLQRSSANDGGRHADQRTGHRWAGYRRRRDRSPSDRRSDVHGLHLRRHGPDRQPGGQDQVHVRRQGHLAADHHHAGGGGLSAAAQHSQSLEACCATSPGSRWCTRRPL